ncbi:MAG: Rne/Rng family ribonuclease, partial [Acidobacteria bacterium]
SEEDRAEEADRSTTAPSGIAEPPSTPEAERSRPDTDAPLDDAEASLRHRRPRAEFAARRKVRRRRSTHRNAGSETAGSSSTATTASPTITELLHEGQELLVQIAKEPIGNKGARVTTHIVLPGRFLVYMPTVAHIGVSRRIPSQAERTRLRRLASKLRSRHKAAGGFIVRTAAEGRTEAELSGDMKYLVRTWNDILRRAEKLKAPALLYREVDLVQRILRDRLSQEFTAIRVDSEEEYTRILDFVNHFQPDLVPRVKLYTRDTPIFEQYGVQPEIEKSIRPRVWLKSGGYIVINQTEALVAIDVNTGKFVGKTHSFEDTITRTNIEAAREIARQIRLRDLGGIIVLDFIDMEERKNRQKVMQVLEDELKKDRAPAKILSFNDFGLVAITRKRVRQSLERTLCEPCPYCHGRGMIKSPETVCYEMFDEVRRLASQAEEVKEVVLRVHPVVERALREKYPQVLEAMESYLKGKVNVEIDPLLHQERFDIALV